MVANSKKTKDYRRVVLVNHCNIYKATENVNTDYYSQLVL